MTQFHWILLGILAMMVWVLIGVSWEFWGDFREHRRQKRLWKKFYVDKEQM